MLTKKDDDVLIGFCFDQIEKVRGFFREEMNKCSSVEHIILSTRLRYRLELILGIFLFQTECRVILK